MAGSRGSSPKTLEERLAELSDIGDKLKASPEILDGQTGPGSSELIAAALQTIIIKSQGDPKEWPDSEDLV